MVTQVALYARVSSEQQVEGFSIEAQLRAMREFAQAQHWTIFREYVDEGFSAGTDHRPQFQIMMRDARLRQYNGLLIHKLDRLYRNVSQLLETVETLEQNEITLISVLERVDFSTPSGKMLLTNIGMISEFYLNNLREETIKGKYQRALCGLWHGDIPYGYCKGLCSRCDDPKGKGYCPNYGQPDQTDGKRLIAHPKDGVGVQRAFEYRVADGHSDQDVTEMLNALGFTSRRKLTRKEDPEYPGGAQPFCKETVRSILQNPFYMGFVVYRGQLLKGTHPALITPELFAKNKEIRKRWFRNPAQRRATPRVFPLTGIIRCSFCHFSMRGITHTNTKIRYYRDTAREHTSACPRKGVANAADLEAEVVALAGRIRLPNEWKARITQLASVTPERIRIDEQRRLLQSQADRLQKLFVNGDLVEEEYDRRRLKIQTELDQLARQEPAPAVPVKEVARTLHEFLEHASNEELKRILRMLFRTVHVKESVERIEFRKTFIPLLENIPGSVKGLFCAPSPSS